MPSRIAACLTIALLAAGAVASGADAQPPEIGDTRVFTRVGAPGTPEGIAVHDQIVYVGTNAPVKGNAGAGPSKIFRYDISTAEPIDEITVEGQALDETHGIVGMAFDAQGRLYVLDHDPPRLLRYELPGARTTAGGRDHGALHEPRQETHATFPDLPPCLPLQLGTSVACSATLTDQSPAPNSLAFDADGTAYVTDFAQGAIFQISPGGDPRLWFTDPRLDSPLGPNGITVDPTGTTLYFAMTASIQPTTPFSGLIYTLPLGTDRPTAEDLQVFHTYKNALTAPDGIAFGASGRLYVALAGTNQISILGPDGVETTRFPDPSSNEMQEVPYDTPASLAFDGKGSILVTNQSAVHANPRHWAVLEAFVGDVGSPLTTVRPRDRP